MTQQSHPPQRNPWEVGGSPHGPAGRTTVADPAPQWPGHVPPQPGEPSSKAGTLSTIALWVGLGALVSSLIPIVGLVGILVGVAALGIGLVAAFVERSRGRAIAGMVLGAVALPLALAMTLVTGGVIAAALSGPSAHEDVVAAASMLEAHEFADDTCLSVEFDQPAGTTVDYTVRNSCDHATPAALFVVDAVDAHGHVIASGWGDSESLDVTGHGATYSSYAIFDDDVSSAASFEIRDLDANNALTQIWWNGEETTIEA